MFTGIVSTTGKIAVKKSIGDAMRIKIESKSFDLNDISLGDSISVSGVCLTVVALDDRSFDTDVSIETLSKTTLGSKINNGNVNLEKAMKAGARLGGHIVTGHIDGLGLVESVEELKLITKIAKNLRKKAQIGIRINPNIDAKTHTKITTGREEDKFGLNIKTAEKIFSNYRSNPYIDVVGLSTHIGSQITSLNPFRNAFLKIKSLINKINKNEKIIKVLDLGGGVGINYKDQKVINFNNYAKIILNISKELDCNLILEPGRILVAESGILVTSVLFIKKNKKKEFAIIDAGMNDLLRPALYDAYHDVQSIKKISGKKKLYTIVGPICETADTFIKNKSLNKLNTGEILYFKNVGAYGASMASSYNSRPIIMELIVHKNNFSVIRKEDTVVKQISREKIPSWLSKIK